MKFCRKPIVFMTILFSFLLIFSFPAWADHPQDGNHDVLETPADCLGCHKLSVAEEHKDRLGYDNHRLCAYCHYNPSSPWFNTPGWPWDPDPDLAVAITFGRRNTNPRGYIEPVYCAYCHVTENRSTHIHVGEHDHAQVPSACQGCHGNNLKEVHIESDKNLPRDEDLPPTSDPGYAAAYATGLVDLKLSCYNCHGETVIGTSAWDAGQVLFQQDPVVRAAVASGIAGNDVSCDACHPDYHSASHDNTGFPIPQPLSCEDCHSGNVVTEHLVNKGLECGTCHSSTDPQVIAAIQAGQGPGGTYQDCNACHVADHASAHDHVGFPDGDCHRCHSSEIVSEHAAHGYNDCGVCHNDPAYDAIIDLGKSGTDVTCFDCHTDTEAGHASAHDRIYLRTRVGGAETIITSDDDPADGSYDNLPAYLPSLTCGGCHEGIAENHGGNFHSGLRVADLFDNAGNPLPRGAIDPARPWITGPGMLGNWCPTYNRQLPDLTAAFASDAEFLAKVDMGVFEFVRECGSCHVGGGPGVENPFGFAGFASTALDDPLRATALDGGGGTRNVWDFYIDDSSSVIRGNWAESGILDVDCFICHLSAYDNLTRNSLIRGTSNFGQAAAVGGGLAIPDTTSPETLDYNTLQVSRDAANQLYLSHNLTYRISGAPPQNNCMACHLPSMIMDENQVEEPGQWQKNFYTAPALASLDPENSDPLLAANRKPALYRNDMLKRGATWRRDEVHKFMECNGCHSRTSKTQAYHPAAENYLHSPGKGFDPLKYPSAADGTVKLCEDCHVRYGDLDNDGHRDTLAFAPPEMQVYHAQAGLLAKVVPTARRIADASGTEESFLGNHIDIIACTSCHVKKRYSAARSVDHATGASYFNLVGAAPNQLPGAEVVDLAYSWKENVRAKVIDGQPNPDWRRQIFPFNYLTSSYWDNVGTADANGDGFITGSDNGGTPVVGDPFFERTIKAYFAYNYVNPLNNRVASGLSGVSALDQREEWTVAGSDGNVLFTTATEIDAFQALVNGANSGYMPRLNLESRPNLVVHNILPIRSGVGLSDGEAFALGAPDRDQLGKVTAYGCSDCHGGSNGLFNGSLPMLGQARRISDNVEIPLTVAWSGAGDVKTSALAWSREGTPLEIDFSTANHTRDPDRREFLGYDAAKVTALNAIVPADVGVGVEPVADIESIGGTPALGPVIEIVKGAVDVELTAVVAGTAGDFQYRWNVNDVAETLVGQTVSKTFAQTGIWTVRLTVIDEENRISQAAQSVNVVVAGPATQVNVTTTTGSQAVTLALSAIPVHDEIKIFFGDGTRQYISDAAATYTINRNYRFSSLYLKYFDPDSGIYFNSESDYNVYYDQSIPEPNAPDDNNLNQKNVYSYMTSIQVKNSNDIVEVINVEVLIDEN